VQDYVLPLGPSVTLTALASLFTPTSSAQRAVCIEP
jgi:hypothetical protein